MPPLELRLSYFELIWIVIAVKAELAPRVMRGIHGL